jgi:hypothetical protein
MPHQGMVHALEEIHRLLRPAGCLIDIHPAPAPTLIEVHRGGTIRFSTQVPGQTFEDVQCADDALAQVIKKGLFAVEQAGQFDWRTYASSVAELRDHVVQESGYTERPTRELAALRDSEFAARVQGVLNAAGEGSEVARLNPVQIARLNPVSKCTAGPGEAGRVAGLGEFGITALCQR